MLPCTEEEVVAYFILFLIYTSLSTLFGPSRSPFLTSRRYTVWEWHKRSLRVNTRLQRESAINTIQYTHERRLSFFYGEQHFQRNNGSVSCSSNTTPCIVVRRAFIIKPKCCITIQARKVGKCVSYFYFTTGT